MIRISPRLISGTQLLNNFAFEVATLVTVKAGGETTMIDKHTCHELWTEICEIRQIFKGDLIQFCEIFTKITLELPKK